MYWRAPTEAELAEAGLKAKHFKRPEVDLWPECALPFEIYCRVATQWRVGAGGPIGLDYNVVYYEMDREGLTGERRDEVMAGIRIVEAAALAEFASPGK